jgi:hypothetical protein
MKTTVKTVATPEKCVTTARASTPPRRLSPSIEMEVEKALPSANMAARRSPPASGLCMRTMPASPAATAPHTAARGLCPSTGQARSVTHTGTVFDKVSAVETGRCASA